MATGIITTGSAPKALWPGIYAWFGQNYDGHGEQYRDLFEIKNSTKAYEEIVEVIAFGLAPEKNEENFFSLKYNRVLLPRKEAFSLRGRLAFFHTEIFALSAV